MFISETHLPQLLSTRTYTSPECFESEVARLFLPGWHCVATQVDFPNDGSYITLDLFGHPLILWRNEGDVHTFLNVCPHRFSMLRDKACGHIGPRLRCQYHGWEFDKTGTTQKIPDAKSFRPMKQGELGLTKFRTETVGQLVFVTLNDKAADLSDYLGELRDVCQEWFSPESQIIYSLDQDHNANWKAVVENTLESYHIGEVHRQTFGEIPDEKRCSHEIHETWDKFTDNYSQRQDLPVKFERYALRSVGAEPTDEYHHRLRYPNLEFGDMGFYSWTHTIVPISPSWTRTITRVFCKGGTSRSFRARLLRFVLRTWGKKFFARFLAEDAGIYTSIQKGLSSPELPDGGLLSIREERLFHFQEYVKRATASETSDSDELVSTGKM